MILYMKLGGNKLSIRMKQSFLIIMCLLCVFFSACIKSNNQSEDIQEEVLPTIEIKPLTPTISVEPLLEEALSVEAIKEAFEAYINERLWLYPQELTGDTSGKSFDSYIGQQIDVEVRAYKGIQNRAYIHTSIGDSLAVFKVADGVVYCDGQVTLNENKDWPTKQEYVLLDQYEMTINKPHKIDYGTSVYKDKVIEAIISKVKASCKQLMESESTWVDAEVFVADFYEYVHVVDVWISKVDGSIVNYPVYWEEKEGSIEVNGIKGFEVSDISELVGLTEHIYNWEKESAVARFICKISD